MHACVRVCACMEYIDLKKAKIALCNVCVFVCLQLVGVFLVCVFGGVVFFLCAVCCVRKWVGGRASTVSLSRIAETRGSVVCRGAGVCWPTPPPPIG